MLSAHDATQIEPDTYLQLLPLETLPDRPRHHYKVWNKPPLEYPAPSLAARCPLDLYVVATSSHRRIVIGRVNSIQPLLVLKIYPAYLHPDEDEDVDPVALALRSFCQEATVYMQFLQHTQGRLVPRCFGAYWVAELGVFGLVLEHIAGVPVSSPTVSKSREQLLVIARAEWEFFKKTGVVMDDLAPRNVMLRPDGSVVFVDFEHVKILEGPKRKRIMEMREKDLYDLSEERWDLFRESGWDA